MRPPFRPALGAALVVLVVGAALAGESGRASAESDESPDSGTITTVLQPGWNMVGWLGPEAPATDLFEAIPALVRASAWDAAEQRYQRRTRTSVARYGLRDLEPGMGLWLELGGDAPFEWTRPAPEGGVLLSLRAGDNLVGWAGRDRTAIEDALARFGDALVRAWQWDAEAQAYDQYRPTTADSSNTLRELSHGDALWVELTGDARWWQSGSAPAPVVFLGDFTEDERAEVRGWMDSARAIYMERWSLEAPMTIYVGDLEALAPTYRRIRGHAPPEQFCGNYRGGVFFLWGCIYERAVAHDYFHAIQDDLSAGRYGGAPNWMVEGSAEYAESVYTGSGSASLTVREHVAQDIHRAIAGIVRYAAPDLSELKSFEDFHAQPNSLGYRLGFLALDWLVGRSSEASTIGFFRALAGGQRWQEAFESAFGIAVDDFYEAFEAYRSEVAPPLPHLTDDVDEPVLVLLGDVPTETQEEVRAAFANVQAFFSERFEAGTADYTVYAAVDAESVAEAYVRAFGGDPYEGFCSRASGGAVALAVIDLSCRTSAPHYLDRYHYDHVRDRLAPWSSLPEAEDGLGRRGPWWLRFATKSYTEHAYEATAGSVTFEDIRDRQVALAKRVTPSLASLELRDDADGVGYWEARALTFLAGEWLAEHAGEPTLFEYYRQLPSSANWQDAFEASFGITADAFYEDFEAHRAEVAPPLPHLTDDSDEPVLVLVGEMPPETKDAIRERFANLQTFFGERFDAGTAPYTVYVGADEESLADIYLRAYGAELPDDFCSQGIAGVVVIVTVACAESQPLVLHRHHFHTIRERLAPWESLPPAPEGYDRRGPQWLLPAITSYLESAFEVATGTETFDEIRNRQLWFIQRTPESLSSLGTWDDVHAVGSSAARALSFLAGEWLANSAGEPALFDYFRQLPTSDTWQEAFEAAFGMTVDDFHEAFEAHRAEVAPPFVLHHVRGFVVDPDGNPSAGAWVAANRGEGRWEDAASTGADGAFDLVLRDGSYYLNVDLTTTGCQVPTDDRLHPGGEIVVDGADVTAVEIRLPEGSSCGAS